MPVLEYVDPIDLLTALSGSLQHAYLGVGNGRRPVFASEAFCSLPGYTLEELLALESTAVFTPPEDKVQSANALNGALSGGDPIRRRRELVHRDGRLIAVEATAQLLPLRGGQRIVLTAWWPLAASVEAAT